MSSNEPRHGKTGPKIFDPVCQIRAPSGGNHYHTLSNHQVQGKINTHSHALNQYSTPPRDLFLKHEIYLMRPKGTTTKILKLVLREATHAWICVHVFSS